MNGIRNLLEIATLLLAFAFTTGAQLSFATLRPTGVLHVHSFSVTVNFRFLLMEHGDVPQLALKRRRGAVACDF